jgi:hypothetical protein
MTLNHRWTGAGDKAHGAADACAARGGREAGGVVGMQRWRSTKQWRRWRPRFEQELARSGL